MGNDDGSLALLSLTTTDGGDDSLLGAFASKQDQFFLYSAVFEEQSINFILEPSILCLKASFYVVAIGMISTLLDGQL
jgi:hypothetical protein